MRRAGRGGGRLPWVLSAAVHLLLLAWFPLQLRPRYAVECAPRSHDLEVVELELESTASRPTGSDESTAARAASGNEVARRSPARADAAELSHELSQPVPPGATTAPRPESVLNVPPVYPTVARHLGYEGLVLLRVEVDKHGRCSGIEIARSSGYLILDKAAVEAVERWLFKPATYLGMAVAVMVDVPIRFRLEDWEPAPSGAGQVASTGSSPSSKPADAGS